MYLKIGDELLEIKKVVDLKPRCRRCGHEISQAQLEASKELEAKFWSLCWLCGDEIDQKKPDLKVDADE